MIAETPFSILDLDLSRVFEHDETAYLLVRDGTDAILATLTQSTSGWNVEDAGDGAITAKIAEGTVPREDMMAAASLVWSPVSGVAEVFANGAVVPWRLASDQVWTAKLFRPVEDYVPPVVDGALGSPWLFWLGAAGQ